MKCLPPRSWLLLLFVLTFASQAANYTINISSIGFSPTDQSIAPGDTVTWFNEDAEEHTVSSVDGAWAPIILFPTESFTQSFTNANTYDYRCDLNGFMGRITVSLSNNAPTVSITSPAKSAVFAAPAAFTISATATDTDGTIAGVEFAVDSLSLGTDTVSPYRGTATNLAPGTYILYAIATDNLGARVTNSVDIVVTLAPLVSIIAPTHNTLFEAPAAISISAEALDEDGSVTNVQFLRNSTPVGSVSSPPYGIVITNIAAGTYTLRAIATDNLGAKNTNSVRILVNAPPVVTVTSPTNNSVYFAPATFSLSATAWDPTDSVAAVEFFVGLESIGNDTSTPYSIGVSNIVAGTHIVTAVAIDAYGTKSTNSVTVIVHHAPRTPVAPGPLTATAVSVHQVNLSWSDNDTNETGFIISMSKAAGGPYVYLGTLAANATNYNRDGLVEGTTYHFRVQAENTNGFSEAAETYAATFAPLHLQRIPAFMGTATETFDGFNLRTVMGWNDVDIPIFSNAATIAGPHQWIWTNSSSFGGARPHDGIQYYGMGAQTGTTRIQFSDPVREFGGYWAAEVDPWRSEIRQTPIIFRFYDSAGAQLDASSVMYSDLEPNGTLEWFGWQFEFPIYRVEYTGAFVVCDSLRSTAYVPLKMVQTGISGDGRFQFRVCGNAGEHLVERSLDLKIWTSLTNIILSNSFHSVVDPDPSQQPQRFYRVRRLR